MGQFQNPPAPSVDEFNEAIAKSIEIGSSVTVTVSASSSGFQYKDVDAEISDVPSTLNGKSRIGFYAVSTTYRVAPVGMGGTRLFYYVGTTITSVNIYLYPLYA